MMTALRLVCRLWQGLRQWSGDDAYERYVRSHNCTHKILNRKEFYRWYFDRRALRPRCC